MLIGALLLLALWAAPASAQDCGTTEVRCVPSEYATIQLCLNAALAGDTCLVDIDEYDEAVSTVRNGSAGSPITLQAVTDCVSNNGETVAGSCANVRRISVGHDHIVIQGFGFTSVGMTPDANRVVLITSAADTISFLNNYVHDSNYPGECVNGSGTNQTFRGNRVSMCRPRMTLYGTVFGPYNIQTGVNDKLSISIQGGAPQTVTLTAGAARTVAQIGTDIGAALTGEFICNGSPCSEYLNVASATDGLTSSIELLAIANDAYTTLGMTVGFGEMYSYGPGFLGTATDWLLEYNYLEHVSDCFNPTGTRVVFRDNICGANDEFSAVHIDAFQPGAATEVLIENVVFKDGGNVQHHVQLNENAGADHWIYRFTQTCRHRGSVGVSGGANQLYFYNNTFYDNAAFFQGVAGGQIFVRNLATDNLGRNNIWYNSTDLLSVYEADGSGAIAHDYDLWWEVPDPGGSNNVNADPLVTNGATCDFTLQDGSPAIDQGGPLTTVAAGDSGSGTTLVLTDARPFQDGWAGVIPDAIAVGTVGNIAQIVSIDYSTGEVTIDAGITRNDGDPVWLYANTRGDRVLYGDAPDMGALEFQPPPVTAIGPIRLPRRKGH